MMTENEKISMLEEIMELDEGTLQASDVLADYDEWDSVTALSLIALMDEQFGKTITGDTIKEFKVVADVLAIMEK